MMMIRQKLCTHVRVRVQRESEREIIVACGDEKNERKVKREEIGERNSHTIMEMRKAKARLFEGWKF